MADAPPPPAKPPPSAAQTTAPPGAASNNIKVVCRFRPQNDVELREGGQVCVDVAAAGDSVVLNAKDAPSAPFAFDRVFDSDATQREIFDYSVKSIVNDVLAGYNGTVFAYGQTGSGKTYTMMGSSVVDDASKGVTPRIVESIFAAILDSPSTMEYTVKVAYLEIYMEKIRDLLNPSSDNLPIHEEKTRGVYVKGLLEVYVSSLEEVFEVMRRGSQARAVSSTNMNAESSRSHSIFVITITQKNTVDGSAKVGRLFLVDLAGSEKVGKTGASGQTLEEAKKINKSLSALGMVINALTDGKHTHIPYRDSKLTRILQESLGGNSRTTLIINCSPSSWNAEETISTLRFGMRAKCIRNKAKINAELSATELKALLRKAKQQAVTFEQYARALEQEVEVWRAGGSVPKERQVSHDLLNSVPEAGSASSARGGITDPLSTGVLSSADLASRPPTPGGSSSINDDEREEFLKRENELTDSLAERDLDISEKSKLIDCLRDELKEFREAESEASKENKELTKLVCDLRRQLERVTYENKDALITVDSLRETNDRLAAEFEEMKMQMQEARQALKHEEETLKEVRKRDKMEKMMAELDTSRSLVVQNLDVAVALSDLADMHPPEASSAVDVPADLAEAAALRAQLDSARLAAQKAESMATEFATKNEELARRNEEAEHRLVQLEEEYEDMMDKYIADEDAGNHPDYAEAVREFKAKLESHYAQRVEQQRAGAAVLKNEVLEKTQQIEQLSDEIAELRKALQVARQQGPVPRVTLPAADANGEAAAALAEKEKDLERIRKATAQQLAEFEMVKRSLMRDLQNRCEKVVELEMALDESRELYSTAVKAVNSKAQQKKMAFLERNLEQLTNIQKQLVEQNASLKKEVAVCERKLSTRNDRISSLEVMLQEAQERLASQSGKFEQQLGAVRERLEQARMQQQQQQQQQQVPGQSQLLQTHPPHGFELGYGRIAKPLRGRGAAPVTTQGIKIVGTPAPAGADVFSSTPPSPSKHSESTLTTKRTSWLGWQRS